MEPGKVLIAPGDHHMRVRKSGLKDDRHAGPGATGKLLPASCGRALSLGGEKLMAAAVISVILTGMGYDGLRGMEVLKAHGAYVIAQDEATSVVWGMPGAVVNAGLADSVVPLDEVVPEILRRTCVDVSEIDKSRSPARNHADSPIRPITTAS